jgi:phosphoribosylglycinamide formyltransferase-1
MKGQDMPPLPKLLVFASGSAEGGGSGFENLVRAVHAGVLKARIVGVVSNHLNGGVREKADRLFVPFFHFPKPWTPEKYQEIAQASRADFFALSGWLKLVSGLDPETAFNSQTVFNIHPGPLPAFGGPGLYGHHVHEAVHAAYQRGELTHSAVSMHFVTDEYDKGPIFFSGPVEIRPEDTPETLGFRVNAAEHKWQPYITNLVVNGEIAWDGVNPASLVKPAEYQLN